MAVSEPQSTSSPVEWRSPAPIDTSTSTPSSTDAQRPGHGRSSPRRAIIDFHGSRARMAKPAAAWKTRDQRAGAVAKANASHPVRKAAASRTSRARLVGAPRSDVDAGLADGLGFEPKTALRLYSISSAAPSTGLGHPSRA